MRLNKKKPMIASLLVDKSKSQMMSLFVRMFKRNRLQNILAHFHLVDTSNLPKPNEQNYDPGVLMQPKALHV